VPCPQALGANFPSAAAWVSFWLVHWLNMVNYGMTFAAATHILTFQKVRKFKKNGTWWLSCFLSHVELLRAFIS